MASLATYWNWFLSHEGRDFEQDPADPGGATRYGIDIRSAQDFETRGIVPGLVFGNKSTLTPDDIAGLDEYRAQIYYSACWWRPMRLDGFSSERLAAKIFDTAVNLGLSGATTIFQQAANTLGASLAVDGNLGPKTIAAIKAADPDALMETAAKLQAARYRSIVTARPDSAKFLDGWLARADDLPLEAAQ